MKVVSKILLSIVSFIIIPLIIINMFRIATGNFAPVNQSIYFDSNKYANVFGFANLFEVLEDFPEFDWLFIKFFTQVFNNFSESVESFKAGVVGVGFLKLAYGLLILANVPILLGIMLVIYFLNIILYVLNLLYFLFFGTNLYSFKFISSDWILAIL